MVTGTDFQGWSLASWEREFAYIYDPRDERLSISDMWLLLVESASKVAEYLRRYKFEKALNELPVVFCLTCRFNNKCRKDVEAAFRINTFEEIVWSKYPYTCLLCGGEDQCICPIWRHVFEEMSDPDKAAHLGRMKSKLQQRKLSQRNRLVPTLDGFADLFKDLYKGAHYEKPLDGMGFHFMEEVGEVSEAIRKIKEKLPDTPSSELDKLTRALEEEIADVFSWTNSLIIKLGSLLGDPDLKLSSQVWQVFKDGTGQRMSCPECRKLPCERKCVPTLE